MYRVFIVRCHRRYYLAPSNVWTEHAYQAQPFHKFTAEEIAHNEYGGCELLK